MAKKNNHETSKEVIAAREKAAEALEMRKRGWSFTRIADEAGFNSAQAANYAVRQAIKGITRETAKELVELELGRLDEMFGEAFEAAKSGDPIAIAACLKIMERRAKYCGLDSADKHALFGGEGGPDVPGRIMLVPFGSKVKIESEGEGE